MIVNHAQMYRCSSNFPTSVVLLVNQLSDCIRVRVSTRTSVTSPVRDVVLWTVGGLRGLRMEKGVVPLVLQVFLPHKRSYKDCVP